MICVEAYPESGSSLMAKDDRSLVSQSNNMTNYTFYKQFEVVKDLESQSFVHPLI
jgi:hypothetical protein